MTEGLNLRDVRDYVIRPVLAGFGPPLDTEAAEHLLLGTAAHESGGFRYLDQATPGPGPAYGLYQMEGPTLMDTMSRCLARWPDLMARAVVWRAERPDEVAQLGGNLYWATAMARLKYWLVPEPLPLAGDVDAMARMWKVHWNSMVGKGKLADFVNAWNRYVAPRM